MDIMNFEIIQWIWIIISAILIGFSKTGVNIVATLVIALLANILGGRDSTGIMLPMLIIGDIFAVYYYNRHAEWDKIKKLLPWVSVGLLLGAITGKLINDKQFKIFIAISIILCLLILIYMEIKKGKLKVPKNIWIFIIAGILTGFTTMIGNAAGPIFSIYLLAMGLDKNKFMGTMSWSFFIINIMKLPFQIFFWNNITPTTILVGICLIPVIAVGAILGSIFIKRINEKIFHKLILFMTAVAALRLLM
ncbi:hypothetical protein EDD66_101184 [Mobilisporobacter senegalensis]|uniref:Probable membrane transporter protein n=1 Tax=Mobilisporobacter senegalensis TaxID=1329262 RepID=A0A3N1Y2S4_9FIRM|nr:sulfite exporter TauE/SafE family protein [Mobilisporobacter senegalensis]ROR31567.1 hypothetical protein EDD66_101184 [Mobilisporobacter senegalensis]